MRFPLATLVIIGGLTLIGCGASNEGGDTATPNPTTTGPPPATAPATSAGPTTTAPTTTAGAPTTAAAPISTTTVPPPEGFAGQVLPVLERSCARCHTGDGPGTPHLSMETVGDVAAAAHRIGPSLQSTSMPPWPAAPGGVAFADSFAITDEERAALVAWAAEPELDLPADRPISSTAEIRTLGNPDLVIEPAAAYDSTAYQPDEYRCFIYDPGFTEDTWLAAYHFVPGQPQIVHHAIGYHIDASRRDAAEALDAAHPDNAGWPCFGSSGLGRDEIFLGWAPGQGPTRLPEGSGLPIGAGDFLVIQVHYHVELDVPDDRSTLRLEVVDDPSGIDDVTIVEFVAPAEIPCANDEEGPLCDRATARDAAIAKYGQEGVLADTILAICGTTAAEVGVLTDGRASASCDLPVRQGGAIVSVLGHQHELGASFRMTLHPDTDREVVLLDIPDWRFDWQLRYSPVEPIEVSGWDTIRIECTWDRARRDADLEPAYVLWADGTDDEMCFATVAIRSR